MWISRLEVADRVLNGLGSGGVILTLQLQRGPEPDRHVARSGHPRPWIEHAIEPLDPHRHDRHVQPRADHPDAGPEGVDLLVLGPAALRKDQDREAIAQQLSNVAQGVPRAGLALGQRKGVEKAGSQIVVQAVRASLPR
jgi:hypothetical protein